MAFTSIVKANTQKFKFTFVDTAGAAVDITGWRIIFMAKDFEDDLDVNAVITVDATAGSDGDDNLVGGIMYLTVSSVDSNVPVKAYHYSFKRIIAGSPPDIRTLDLGTFKITKLIRVSNT